MQHAEFGMETLFYRDGNGVDHGYYYDGTVFTFLTDPSAAGHKGAYGIYENTERDYYASSQVAVP